jgi:hypothetical protein
MNAMILSGVPARRHRSRIRIWIPLTLLLVLLSPVLLLLIVVIAAMLWRLGPPPGRTIATLVRLLLSLRGTRIEVEAPGASVRITIL